jgi:biotin carboxyl carrier protein
MEYEFLIEGKTRKISIEKKEKAFLFSDAAGSFEAEIHRVSEDSLSIITGGSSHLVSLITDKDKKFVFLEGEHFLLQEPGSAGAESEFQKGEEKTPGGNLRITAPMPGKVIKINVAEGQEVRKNQTLAIVEAMKMENELKASAAAVVKKIHVNAGELVDSSKTLLELEPKK